MRAVLKAIMTCSLIFSFWLILPKEKLKESLSISSNNVKAGGEARSYSFKTIWEEVKANLR